MSSGDYESDDLDLLRAARAERPRDDLRARALVAATLAGGAAVTKGVVTKVAATKVGAKMGFGATLTALFAGARVLVVKPLVAVLVLAGASALVVERTRDVDADQGPTPTLVRGRALGSAAEGAARALVVRADALASPHREPEVPMGVEAPPPPRAPSARVGFVPPKPAPVASNVATESASAPSRSESLPRPAGSSLADEVTLVDDARAALRRGDVARALTRLETHATRFPSGALTIERDALRIEALATQGREAEARAAALSFTRAHPGAPIPPRAKKALEGDAKNVGGAKIP